MAVPQCAVKPAAGCAASVAADGVGVRSGLVLDVAPVENGSERGNWFEGKLPALVRLFV